MAADGNMSTGAARRGLELKLSGNTFFKEPRRSTLARGRFDHVAPDDDILYAMVGQRGLEEFGPGFSREQAWAS